MVWRQAPILVWPVPVPTRSSPMFSDAWILRYALSRHVRIYFFGECTAANFSLVEHAAATFSLVEIYQCITF